MAFLCFLLWQNFCFYAESPWKKGFRLLTNKKKERKLVFVEGSKAKKVAL